MGCNKFDRKTINIVTVCVLCQGFAWYNQNWNPIHENEGVRELHLHLWYRWATNGCTYRTAEDELCEGI